MQLLDRSLARIRRRRRAQRAIDALGPAWAVGAGLAAAGVFAIRLAIPAAEAAVPALAAAGLLLPLAVLPAALRRRDERWHLAAELDRRCAAEGLVMAAAEGQRGWDAAVAARLAALPPQPRSWRACRPAGIAAACLAVAIVLPQAAAPAVRPPAGAAFTAPVAARAAALADQRLVPDELARSAVAEAAAIDQRARGDGLDALGWEALDRLARRLDAAGERSARALADALAAAAASAATAADAAPEAVFAAAADLAAALDALDAAAPGLAALDPAAAAALAAAARDAAAAGRLDPALAERLLRRAGGRCAGGSCSAGALADLGRLAEDGLAAHRARLAALGLDAVVGARLAQGIRPGGGPAALTRVERPQQAVGEAAGLPPGATLDADGSVVFATIARDPPAEAVAAAARAAAAAFDPAAADARRAAVAPRHRAAVAAYFAAAPAPAPAARPSAPPAARPSAAEDPAP